eukprot:5212166-Alexandrium_andersonii.AAC.1
MRAAAADRNAAFACCVPSVLSPPQSHLPNGRRAMGEDASTRQRWAPRSGPPESPLRNSPILENAKVLEAFEA